MGVTCSGVGGREVTGHRVWSGLEKGVWVVVVAGVGMG